MTGAHQPSSNQLHPLLRSRFSPLMFDPTHALTPTDELALLEAARWAPSAGNSQPWSFHFAHRHSPGHRSLLRCLAPSALRWAPSASALIVNLARREFDESGLEYSEFADYDLGQAVAHMTIQACSMGLACRQFRAFDLARVASAVQAPAGWHVVTMTAIGRAASVPTSRVRRPVDDIRLAPAPEELG